MGTSKVLEMESYYWIGYAEYKLGLGLSENTRPNIG